MFRYKIVQCGVRNPEPHFVFPLSHPSALILVCARQQKWARAGKAGSLQIQKLGTFTEPQRGSGHTDFWGRVACPLGKKLNVRRTSEKLMEVGGWFHQVEKGRGRWQLYA